MKSKAVQQIDIDNIIRNKWGKKLPKWLIRIVKRIIHQDDINDVLFRLNGLEGVAFMGALKEDLNIHIEVKNRDKLPSNPRAIFVCNHPLGGIDGVCLSHLIGEHYQSEVRYIVNDLLFNLDPLKKIFIPVNTLGKQSRDSLTKLHSELTSDLPVLTFPAGFCSRDLDGKIQDVPWKKSFIKMSKEYNRPIVPIFFEGLNSKRFYQLEKFRRKIGIKFNIGMTLLPSELFRSKNKSYTIHIGDPIPVEKILSSSLSQKEWVAKVREEVYSLPSK